MDYQGTVLDFESPFRRATMSELVAEATGGLDIMAFESSPGGEEGLKAAREAGVKALQEKVGGARPAWGVLCLGSGG